MRAFQFSRPKGPGFGIQRNFYLSVLSSRPVMPSILQVINPQGAVGAVTGFGAPLTPGATKESLSQPLGRGAYALATKDRKTVLKMLVLSKEEAGFDPEPFVRSSLAQDLDSELVTRVRATWIVAQLTFESHDPTVYPALDFVLSVARRMGELTDGVVADPVSQRYLLPEQVAHPLRFAPEVDARDFVSVAQRTRPDGLHIFTLGLQKFGLPELEIIGLTPGDVPAAETLLISLAQVSLLGQGPKSGDKVGAADMPFELREGGFDPALWEGIPCLELLPPTTHTAGEALAAWRAEMS
jgi:hypothetical protein